MVHRVVRRIRLGFSLAVGGVANAPVFYDVPPGSGPNFALAANVVPESSVGLRVFDCQGLRS